MERRAGWGYGWGAGCEYWGRHALCDEMREHALEMGVVAMTPHFGCGRCGRGEEARLGVWMGRDAGGKRGTLILYRNPYELTASLFSKAIIRRG